MSTLTNATKRYKITEITTTYPIWEKISQNEVLKIIMETILTIQIAIKHTRNIRSSLFSIFDDITKSFILYIF